MPEIKKPAKYICYAVLILIGINLFMKVWGIWNASSNDEYVEVIEALRIGSGHLNFERWNKRVFLFILAFEFALYYVAGYILGMFQSTADFAVKVARDMEPLLIMGRATSAVLGTAAVWVTYKIGEKVHSAKAGFIAAVFMTFTASAVKLSHYARVDVLLLFLMLCSMYYIVRIYQEERQSWKTYALAGIFMGLAFQCKIQGVILLVPALTAYFFRREKGVSVFGHFVGRMVWACMLFFIVGLILGNPAILIAPEKFVGSILKMGTVYSNPMNVFVPKHIGYISYIHAFSLNMGKPLSFVMFLSLPWLAARSLKKREYIILLSYIVVFYLVVGGSKYNVIYSYILPLYPLLHICAAIVLIGLVEMAFDRTRTAAFVLTVLCLVVLVYPVKRSTEYMVSVSQKNTRITSKEWIEKNIPPHSRIIMDSGMSINSFAPMIAEDETSIKRTISVVKEQLEKGAFKHGLIDTKSLIYYELLLKTVPEISYNITSSGQGLYLKDLDHYRDNGFEYAIISKEVSSRFLKTKGRNVRPVSTKFYEDIFSELCHVKTIAPKGKSVFNDTFYIHAFNDKECEIKKD